MSAITTHVLDTTRGRPAQGVPVRLEALGAMGGTPTVLATATTDADGRVPELGPDQVEPGAYRLVFDTASYYRTTGESCFFPEISITFTVDSVADGSSSQPYAKGQRYHVPVLLSPFAYSAYRGS